jgi:hypothetical protein
MNNYVVLYKFGMGGTWLGWFINSHENFAQYDVEIRDRGVDLTVDVACEGLDWWINTPGVSSWQELEYPFKPTWWINEDDSEAFRINRIMVTEEYTTNYKHTKDCIRVLPNHDLTEFNEVNPLVLNEVVDEIKPTKIIVPILKDYLFNEFSDRWIYFQKCKNDGYEPVDERKEWTHWVDYLIKEQPYHNQPYAEVYYCDIGKLISDDGEEYALLCEAIGEEPNDNAREQLDWYKNIILQF